MDDTLLAVAGTSVLTDVDWLAIAFYFGILLAVAWWVIKKSKAKDGVALNRAKTRASWGTREVLASQFVLGCILGAYLYFRG